MFKLFFTKKGEYVCTLADTIGNRLILVNKTIIKLHIANYNRRYNGELFIWE